MAGQQRKDAAVQHNCVSAQAAGVDVQRQSDAPFERVEQQGCLVAPPQVDRRLSDARFPGYGIDTETRPTHR
jgi:hypothetical protein